ncbi:carbohydrate ABC transporter substrate-binding protein, CUT1 family [Caldanaerobius fijiensis DSM 17918]|uniref:Carbohydrate ABC transporter substrate-binding protein, CUT1 family n=1 Tax=Caldanaerobius fijiensis DSM 17918 TaxID=1121256 RepID=A0A1M5DAC6_9THEO|nr:sugar ABC transporter substrate-binding protein [Caldanaerobius fijiensis]SHF63642.1 carbohydrate ABC transporter substrate-binding protein, CUT1 family [Caldanaerobius fijiensis DSM 17918]
MRKAFSLLLSLIIATSVFVGGCSNSSSSKSASSNKQNNGKVANNAQLSGEITVWGWPAADTAFKAIMPGFNKLYPNIKVKVIMMKTDDVHTKLLSSLAAKSGAPDVSMVENGQIGKFAASGGLEDLRGNPYLADKLKDDFVSYAWSEATTMDGRQIGIPWDIGPASLFYRRDIFEKAGLKSDPESVTNELNTWDKFIEVGKKIKAATGGKTYMMSNAENMFSLYFTLNHNYFDDKYNLLLDPVKMASILDISQKARENGIDAKVNMWTPEWQAMFKNGTLATEMAGCWFGGFLKTWIAPDLKGKWGVAPIPENAAYNWGGSFLVIPSQSKNKEAAWAFIKYALATKEGQNAMFKAVDYFPAYKPAWDDPIYHEQDEYFGGEKTRELWIKIAGQIPNIRVTKMDPQVSSILTQEAQKAIDQKLDSQKTMEGAIKKIQQAIAQDLQTLKAQMK